MIVAVSRTSGLIVGQQVSQDRDLEMLQVVVDTLPPAPRYSSNGHAAYQEVVWPEGSQHVLSLGKEETHTVESVNANLRTYLKCLREPLLLFQPLAGGAVPSRALLCLFLQPAAALLSRSSSVAWTFASARLATPADWSLGGSKVSATWAFLGKRGRLAPRLRAEVVRHGQPVPRVNLPGR